MNELREKLAEFGYLPEGEVPLTADGGGYLAGLDGGYDLDGGDDVDTQEVAEAIASLRGDDIALAGVHDAEPSGVEGDNGDEEV